MFDIQLRDGDVCIYCGGIATDRDHVPPFSLTDKSERTFYRHEVVPACRNCNGALHNKPLLTLATRAGWLSERFQRKLSALPPPWNTKEIATLGYALQQYVKRTESKRIRLESASAHCERLRIRAVRVGLTPEMYWDTQDVD